MATINTEQVIYDFNGKAILYRIDEENNPETLTVKTAVITALLESGKTNELSEEQKFERWNLAKKFNENSTAEITSKDVVLIRACANTIFPTAIFVPFATILEG